MNKNVEDISCDQSNHSAKMGQVEHLQFRKRNGRPDWNKINSMPDLFIRPDQRGDIKTFTNAAVIPPVRKMCSPSTRRNVAAASRWDANNSSHTVELTPPTLRGLVSPSSGRKKKVVSPKTSKMKSIHPVPFSFETSDHTNTSTANGWSATKQPQKSAMKKKKSKGDEFETRFHSSMSALDDADIRSASSSALTSCSLVKNTSSCSETTTVSEPTKLGATKDGSGNDEESREARERRWKALSGPCNGNNEACALPSSPTCPSRHLASRPSESSLSCPPPLTTYADDDDTTADKSCTSCNSMDLAIDDSVEQTKGSLVTSSIVKVATISCTPESQKTSKAPCTAYSSCHINTSVGSTGIGSNDQCQKPSESLFQFQTPKSESHKVTESCAGVLGSKPLPVLHNDAPERKCKGDATCKRKPSPKSVTKELDITLNNPRLLTEKRAETILQPLDRTRNEASRSKMNVSQDVKHLTTMAGYLNSSSASHETTHLLPLVPSPIKNTRNIEKDVRTTATQSLDSEWNAARETSQMMEGDVIKISPEGMKASSGKERNLRQKRRGSTGALAKLYEENIASPTVAQCAAPNPPQMSRELRGSTFSLVQQWEAKIRESKPSSRKERQDRRGSTGSLAKTFGQEPIPARPTSSHISRVANSEGSPSPRNAALHVYDIGSKPSDMDLPPKDLHREANGLFLAPQEPLEGPSHQGQRRRHRRGSTGTLAKKFEEELFSSTKPLSSPPLNSRLRSVQGTSQLLDPNNSSKKCTKIGGATKPLQVTGNFRNQGDASNCISSEEYVVVKPKEEGPRPAETRLSSYSEHSKVGSLQPTHSFETCYGSVDLNDGNQPLDQPVNHSLEPSAFCPTKCNLDKEHALSPRARQESRRQTYQQLHQNRPPQQLQQRNHLDSDLTPRRGRKQRRRGSTGALAKKFEEELIPGSRPSPTNTSPLKSPRTNRRRGSVGAIAKLWEENSSRRVGPPPLTL